MPSVAEFVKPTPAPRCPSRHHPFRAGCRGCRRWAVYQRNLTIWERAHGISRAYVPIDQTREHLHYLTTQGNRTVADIAAQSGVSWQTVRAILDGQRTRLYPITSETLLAIQPRTAPTDPLSTYMVPSTEGVRLLRGMFAQGWSWPHIADQMGGVSGSAAFHIAKDGRPWMLPVTLERIRAVARELGRYDLRTMDPGKRRPGMDIRCVNQARRNGWYGLGEWRGLDITDPNADPSREYTDDFLAHLMNGADTGEPDLTDVPFIDPVLTRIVTGIAQRIMLESPDDTGRTGDTFIPTITPIRRLELHAAWWIADTAGMNDTQIAMMLGYPMDARKGSDFEAGKRQMIRIADKVRAARDWIDSDPAGVVPTWFNLAPPPGRSDLSLYLPALIAVQDPPFGAGWSVTELAERCGVAEGDMRSFLALATREGNRTWQPQLRKNTTHPGRATRCDSPDRAQAAA